MRNNEEDTLLLQKNFAKQSILLNGVKPLISVSLIGLYSIVQADIF